MARRDRTSESGTTLLEMIVYFAVLILMINLGVSVFVSSTRISMVGTSVLDRMETLRRVQSDFTHAVRMADGVEARVGDYISDADQIVLRQSPASGDAPVRYTVFGRLGEEPRLSKLVLAGRDGVLSVESHAMYPLDLDTIRFGYDVDLCEDARLVSLHVNIDNAMAENAAPSGRTFQAAFRGSVEPRREPEAPS